MKFPGILLLFGGYVLIYAAVAAKGKMASEPWAGLFTDAYTKSPGSNSAGAPQSPNPLLPNPGAPTPLPPGGSPFPRPRTP